MRKNSGLKIMARLFSLVGSLSYLLILAIINGGLGHIFAMFIPVVGAIGVAKMLGASVALSYNALFIIIISLGILRGLLKYLEQYFNHFIAFKMLATLRDKAYVKLCELCPNKLEDKKKGSIISMLTADIETIEVFYAHTLSPLGIAFFCCGAMTIFIGIITNVYIALFALFSYVCVGAILPYISSKSISSLGGDYRESFSTFNGFFMDAIKGSNEIVLHEKNDEYVNTVNTSSLDLLEKSSKLKKRSTSFEAITQVVIISLNVTFIGICVLFSKFGAVEIEWAIVAVVSLISSYAPALALNALPSNLSQTLASGERLLNLIDEQPATIDIENGNDFSFENLTVKNLCFSYDKENAVIENCNLTVKNGEIVGIMGKSGCGKSTLLKLLLRFWEKDGGEILFNGQDVLKINTKSLKKNVTMVSQFTYVFSDTVLNNVKIANKNATDEEVVSACKKAGIHELVCTLENGYQTIVGSGGTSLSAGEMQRLALARAFLSSAKLILLDEPTSNVDAMNEGIILQSLAQNKEERAIIIVSHRESTLSIADKIYSFSKGNCTLQGS